MRASNDDVVVFRCWKDSGDIIALFPEIPADLHGRYCEAYEHVGQHGGADYWGVIQATVPTQAKDFADLAAELDGIGYRLRVRRRASSHTHENRRRAARQIVGFDTRLGR
jgi:hypothetical protein